MKKYFNCLCLAVMAAAALSGCKDDGTPEPTPGKPSVTLTAGTPAADALTFTVQVSEGADKAAYVCVRGGETVPTAEEILSDGTPVSDFAAPVTVEGLEPETAYVIAAAAGAGDAVSDVATLEMTTSAAGTGWDEEFVSLYTEGAYFSADVTGGPNGHFMLMLTDVKTGSNGLPQNAGYLLMLSFHSDLAADADNARPAAGTYGFDLMDSFEKFTFDNNFSSWQRATGPGTYDPAAKLNGGTLTIAETADGYEITALVDIGEGRILKASYTGQVVWENLTSPASYDLSPSSAEAVYVGTADENPDSDFWSIAFSGIQDGGEYIFQLQLYSAVAADPQNPVLGDGNYNPGTGTAAGTWIPGFSEEQGTVLRIAEIGGVKEYRLDEGTVTVTRSGDAYSITCDLTGEEGKPVKLTYNGALTIDNRHQGGDDYLQLTYVCNSWYEGATGANSYSYYIEVSDKEITSSGMNLIPSGYPATLLALQFYSGTGTPAVIPDGTYTVGSGKAPGTLDDNYSGIQYWADADSYQMKALDAGTATVNFASGKYEIVIDVTDGNGENFKAKYSGPLSLEDYSVAPQPTRKMLYSELAGTRAKPQPRRLPGLARIQSAPAVFGGLPHR